MARGARVKLGLIARAEDRGLGNLTREFYAHMRPARTLVVRPTGADQADLTDHSNEWYPDGGTTLRCGWDPGSGLDETTAREFLDGLDVVYSAETFYDWRFCEWAREMKVRTVCHMMPEYFRPGHFTAVDRWWTPTRWRLGHIPESVRVVPVPCPTARFPNARFDVTHTPLTWLHPAGARARKDRNGTMQLIRAIRHLREPHHIVIAAQELVGHPDVPANVTIEVRDALTVENYWDVYDEIDAVILPRKYGGLCMPALEAMSAGCALVMTDVEPQRFEWPIVPIPVQRGSLELLRVYEHKIGLATAQPEDIAAVMDNLACGHPQLVMNARASALGWAHRNSWEYLGHQVTAELESVCG
jgi:hypothetical protein